ncbi:MAG: UDP-N-acetylmuramoyl-L-alanyl-D-glutamate--2,6-diaminopimelate ligase [Gammaproteobacteria bacterium]|nr:UDP-N-acetylmuramoyl-L-alanyl-D-glutamate--2,6-diaminopimelate ligase [Gammaproteobacteria bacterium]
MNGAAQSGWRPLRALLGGQIEVPEQVEIADLTLDSRAAGRGAAFLAVRGRRVHGLQFAREAVARGARVVLWEPAPGVAPPAFDLDVQAIAVPDLGRQAGYIADRFFGAPSAALSVIGITGTNGKTTCAWLLAQALAARGCRARYLGTLGSGSLEALTAGTHTTPDAVTLQRLLGSWRDAGVTHVAMEVSSHALDQERCAGVRFHTAVFTNLSRDHLDYHRDLRAYGEVKARLFDWPTLCARVINADDAFGVELAGRARPGARLILTTRRPAAAAAAAELAALPAALLLRALDVAVQPAGIAFTVEVAGRRAHLSSRLLGEFNVDNLLGVLGVLLALDVPLEEACALLAACTAPPGRMQASGGGPLPLVIVDYAHTPDALDKALRAARVHCAARLWCVFGCGGERDTGKRAAMGAVAAALADVLVITDDNPRGEDPAAIVAAILAGVGRHAQVRVEHDRAAAIGGAVAAAGPGDVVLVAGKGHEVWQIADGERRPFSDAAVAQAALAHRSAA